MIVLWATNILGDVNECDKLSPCQIVPEFGSEIGSGGSAGA